METVVEYMRKSASLAKNILLEAIPRIAEMNWGPICEQYKVRQNCYQQCIPVNTVYE